MLVKHRINLAYVTFKVCQWQAWDYPPVVSEFLLLLVVSLLLYSIIGPNMFLYCCFAYSSSKTVALFKLVFNEPY